MGTILFYIHILETLPSHLFIELSTVRRMEIEQDSDWNRKGKIKLGMISSFQRRKSKTKVKTTLSLDLNQYRDNFETELSTFTINDTLAN